MMQIPVGGHFDKNDENSSQQMSLFMFSLDPIAPTALECFGTLTKLNAFISISTTSSDKIEKASSPRDR